VSDAVRQAQEDYIVLINIMVQFKPSHIYQQTRMNPSRIALIHATALAMKPVQDAFQDLWPHAQCHNILDDKLAADLQTAGELNAPMHQRILDLAQFAQKQGAQGILYTCSSFGPAIEAAQQCLPLPILKPNQAMFDEAFDRCATAVGKLQVGLITTFEPATAPMMQELEQGIAERQLRISSISTCAVGAMTKLNLGDTQAHDQMILNAALAMPPCDVYLLGQFSMARAQSLLAQALGKPVLSSPASAVRSLQKALHMRANESKL
jgi:Asp/Glu/hydantoin racemase